MNNSISKFLVIALLLLNVNQIVKAKVVDAVSGATPVKLKIEANADKTTPEKLLNFAKLE